MARPSMQMPPPTPVPAMMPNTTFWPAAAPSVASDRVKQLASLATRIGTPRSYDETISAMRDLVLRAESSLRQVGTVGVAIPGTLSPQTGLVKNANSTFLIGHPLD